MLRKLLVLFLVTFVSLAPLQAGSGRFADGKFDIFITIGGNATPTQLMNIQERFSQASELLYDATDGQSSFGRVRIFNNNRALEFADVKVTVGSGRANASGCDLGIFGESLDLFTDDDIDGTPQQDAWQTIVHEWAHYAFNVYDEYKGPGMGTTRCVEANPSTSCLMDNYRLPQFQNASEFCWSGNHDPDSTTDQDAVHNEACWQTIADGYPAITMPGMAPVEAAPAGYTAPTFQVFENPRLRVVFVLDTSGSMNASGGISATRIADLNNFARQFIDLMGVGDVELGIVTYNTTANTPFPADLLDSMTKVANAKAAVPTMAMGQTNIGGGLIAGRNLLTATPPPGPLVLILMTDGYHNAPAGDPAFEPLTVLPSIVDADIHVHTVALGDTTNEPLLREIAKQSGGIFWKANNSVQFEPIFTSLAAISREGSMLDAAQTLWLAPGHSHASGAPDETGAPAIPQPLRDELFGHGNFADPYLRPVFVEKYTTEVAFNLGWDTDSAELDLVLLSPSGILIRPSDAGSAPADPILYHGGERYRSFVLRDAEAGVWHYGVYGDVNPDGTTYVIQPTVINPEVRAFANAEAVFPAAGAPYIHLEASARDEVPVTAIEVSAIMTDPTGASYVIALKDDGVGADEFEKDGIYSADVAGIDVTGDGLYHFDVFMEAEEGIALAIDGEEPPPAPDNSTIYMPRSFQRSFMVDVVVGQYGKEGSDE